MKRFIPASALVLLACACAWASFEEGAAAFGQGKYPEAVDALKKEINANPTNTKAYMFLASSYEKLSQWREAAESWEKFAKLTSSIDEKAFGDKRAKECRDRAAGKAVDETPKTPESTEPEGDDAKYESMQPVLSTIKTPHFVVMAKNRALLEKTASECERHLARIMSVFLHGREWSQKITVRVFKDHRDYVIETGMPNWSGGGYSVRPDGAGGNLLGIDLFALDAEGNFIPDLLTKTLPHELTHAVIHESFGERAFGTLPLAINEGLAMYSEEGTAVLYEQQLAEAVKRGVFYKLSELYQMRRYPSNVGLFYAQSASCTRYLIEHMSAKEFETFMGELKRGQSVSSALQTAKMITGDPLDAVQVNWLAMLKEKAKEYAKNPPPKTPAKKPKPGPKADPKTETAKTDPAKTETPEPYDPLKNEKTTPGGDDDDTDVVVEVK